MPSPPALCFWVCTVLYCILYSSGIRKKINLDQITCFCFLSLLLSRPVRTGYCILLFNESFVQLVHTTYYLHCKESYLIIIFPVSKDGYLHS